jgi:NhaP-type Na+/H+ or K+/H+ antiporter
MLGFPQPFIFCLLFGALISPTDPVAVLGVIKSVGVSKRLETKIAAESLFNDGVGVVVFPTDQRAEIIASVPPDRLSSYSRREASLRE